MVEIKIGDTVICNDVIGIIVADIDNGSYSADYPKYDWNYLKTGFIIDTQEAGLIHYPNIHDVLIEILKKNDI